MKRKKSYNIVLAPKPAGWPYCQVSSVHHSSYITADYQAALANCLVYFLAQRRHSGAATEPHAPQT